MASALHPGYTGRLTENIDEVETESEPGEQADVDICLKAPEWAEHPRFIDSNMACDDGRAG